jgi:hypothetical protein
LSLQDGLEVVSLSNSYFGCICWGKWKWSLVDCTIVKWSSSCGVSWISVSDSVNWGNGADSSDLWDTSISNLLNLGNWSNGTNGYLWSWSNWEVGGSNSKSVNWIRNIVSALDDSVSINVVVSSTNNTISGSGLNLGAWASGISVAVLAELILSMILLGLSISKAKWGLDKSSGGDSQSGSENDEGLHVA